MRSSYGALFFKASSVARDERIERHADARFVFLPAHHFHDCDAGAGADDLS